MSKVNCEIVEVPLDESTEYNEANLSPVAPQRKSKRVLTEAQKAQCRKNLVKARAVRAAKKKAQTDNLPDISKMEIEDDYQSDYDSEPKRSHKVRSRNAKDAYTPMKPSRASKMPSSKGTRRDDFEDSYSEYSEDDSEDDIKPTRKSTKSKSKSKAPSEKDKRLRALETKLDEIIQHTKKQAAKPRIRNTKTTIIQTPSNPVALGKRADPSLAKAASRILNMF